MDALEQFKSDILDWSKDFVEKPNPRLGGWEPCPYARSARLQNKVQYAFVLENDFLKTVEETCANFDDQFDLTIVGTFAKDLSPNEINDFSQHLRSLYRGKDIWPLFDHPDETEVVAGVVMNNGKYLLALIQRLSTLKKASEHLVSKGYYDSWNQSDFQQMTKPRS